MSLALSYNIRHLLTRRTTTLMTVFGIGLVVFVFVTTLMLAEGLNQTLAQTGSADNAIVLRQGAQNEVQSGISREHANIVLSQPEVARTQQSEPLATTDVLVLVSLRKRSDGEPSNVNFRGVSALASQVRHGVTIISGRAPARGTREVMVGSAVQKKFAGTIPGESLRVVGTEWPVVGIFDAGDTGFSSEIWGDADVILPTVRREQFSSITFRLAPGAQLETVKERLESERRLNVTVLREDRFYAAQSENLALFIRIMGSVVSVIFSIGAIVGAMITMYSAVSNRTREIGILRAIGFKPRTIMIAFLKECVLIGVLGGVVGIMLASLTSLLRVTTTNFQTFSEVAFGFSLTLQIVVEGLLFSVVMGALGGALPAVRAARLSLLGALRSQ